MRETDIRVLIHKLLIKADRFAVNTVKEGRGGPFGAILAVYDLNSGEYVCIGEPAANAVVKTGDGGRHAENEAMSPAKVRALVRVLDDWKKAGREAVVIMASSGESCPACRAKEETLARYLVSKELIKKGRFIVAHGATFAQTARAGFNDLPYVLDGIRRWINPNSDTSMVRHLAQKFSDAPGNIKMRFARAAQQIAIVARGGKIRATGRDKRNDGSLFASAEINAMSIASMQQKADGVDQPWKLGREEFDDAGPDPVARLYTTTPEEGAIVRSTAAWAKVSEIIFLEDAPASRLLATQEAIGVTNGKLRDMAGKGYHDPDSFLRHLHDTDPEFENAAQAVWIQEKLNGRAIDYNGAEDDPTLQEYMPLYLPLFNPTPLIEFSQAALN